MNLHLSVKSIGNHSENCVIVSDITGEIVANGKIFKNETDAVSYIQDREAQLIKLADDAALIIEGDEILQSLQ